MDVLAKAVFANEGVDISKSANLSGVQGTGTQTISPNAEAWANNILGGKAKLSDLTGKENVALKNEVVKALDQKSGGKAGALEQNTNEALDLINSLIGHPGREAAT